VVAQVKVKKERINAKRGPWASAFEEDYPATNGMHTLPEGMKKERERPAQTQENGQ
jgi:hypothetical protein